ncbi:MAG TPA: hypothetical protein DEF01_00345 [Gemmatimonadetes bacterium]|nr:hypothetical protein [Gemmatimonadota bacterium]HBV05156.1 hypothetical protein [Gemmatimonadota bacterium]
MKSTNHNEAKVKEISKRIVVATAAIPLVLGLMYLGGWYLAVPLATFAGWAAHELYRLAQQKGVTPIEWVGMIASVLFVLFAAWRPTFQGFAPFALAVIGLTSILAALEVMRKRGPSGKPLATAAITVFGAIYTGLALSFAPLLLQLPIEYGWTLDTVDSLASLYVVALPLVATWLGDASAYFVGTEWGRCRSRLAPEISPNKSWVGFWANLAGGSAAGVVWFFVTSERLPGLADAGFVLFAFIGGLLGFAAVLGDLLESVFKREAGVKDSGVMFPGHGGALDRIDSLVFTIPSSYVLLVLLGELL